MRVIALCNRTEQTEKELIIELVADLIAVICAVWSWNTISNTLK